MKLSDIQIIFHIDDSGLMGEQKMWQFVMWDVFQDVVDEKNEWKNWLNNWLYRRHFDFICDMCNLNPDAWYDYLKYAHKNRHSERMKRKISRQRAKHRGKKKNHAKNNFSSTSSRKSFCNAINYTDGC